MTEALDAARRLGLDCVQVFTKNQQQWSVKPLEAEAIATWRGGLSREGQWPESGFEAPRVTSHASYLINLASPDAALRNKSIGLMKIELERCGALGIELLVFHPGAATGGTLEDGIDRIAEACCELLEATAGDRTVMCLENVAGAGTTIGRTLEELATLRGKIVKRVGKKMQGRVGFCLDTCHAHAAGYDLSRPAGAKAFMDEVEERLGASNVRCWHLNDSKGEAGSRLDRHAHIGEGTIGMMGFATILERGWMRGVPKIMETPKGPEEKKGAEAGKAWDLINVERLRGLMEGRVDPGAGVERIEPVVEKKVGKKVGRGK